MPGGFKLARLFLLTLCVSVAPVWPLAAQEAAEESKKTVAAKPAPPPDYASPWATLKTFFDAINKQQPDGTPSPDWEKVFGAMDMPAAAGNARQAVGWKLLGVFNGLGRITREMVPESFPEGQTEFEFFPGGNDATRAAQRLFHPALDKLDNPPGKIVLVRTDTGAWKFSAETLDGINELFSWIEPLGPQYGVDIKTKSTSAWLEKQIPDFLSFLKGNYFLTLALWQWFGLLAILAFSVFVDFIARFLLRPLVRRLTRRYLGDPDETSVRYTVRPLGLGVGAAVFLALLNLLGLTGHALTILVVAGKVVIIVGVAWAAWALTDLASDVLLKKAKATKTTFDDMLVPLVRKTLKLFIVAFSLVYVADSFHIPLAPLLGSLGLAGLAISFAAQDIVKNLFGGVMIFLDRPFEIGERINYQSYDGVIEEIGFRTTRLRTLTGHLVTIPNGSITSDPVENIGRRPYIRRTMNVGLTYDTPREKIALAIEIIRDILEEDDLRGPIHQSIGNDEYPPRIYFNDFGATSLNIIVYYWFMPPAYWDYLEHAEKFHLRLYEEFEKAGIEFAFPTQTLYLAGDPKRPLDIGRPAAP